MTTTTPAELLVIRHLDASIYKSSGGGQSTIYSRHASGPRGLTNALISHGKERGEASAHYGSIGAGAGWIEIMPKGGDIGSGLRVPGDYQWAIQPAPQAPLEWWEGEITAHLQAMQMAHDEIERSERAEDERIRLEWDREDGVIDPRTSEEMRA